MPKEVIDELGLEDSTGILVLGEDGGGGVGSGKRQSYLSPYVDQFMSVHHQQAIFNNTRSPKQLDFDHGQPLREHVPPPPGPRAAVHKAAGI